MAQIRDRDRVRDIGEVFTPLHIVEEMHDQFDNSVWSDPTMIYFEPTCGNGAFILQALKRKVLAGLNFGQAMNTTFGVDIMQYNIDDTRIRIIKAAKRYISDKEELRKLICIVVNNIFCCDSLALIKSGAFADKKFFTYDPTDIGNQVLSKEERLEKILEAKEWYKKNVGALS